MNQLTSLSFHATPRPAVDGTRRAVTDSRVLRLALASLEQKWSEASGNFACWISPTEDFTERRPVAPDVFGAMIIADLVQSAGLTTSDFYWNALSLIAEHRTDEGLHHFFTDRALLVADVDCTAVGHSVLWRGAQLSVTEALRTARRILANTNDDGVIAVYFTDDPDRKGLIDPAVCANALHFIGDLGLSHKARPTMALLEQTLLNRSYEEGTRYYPSPDVFLYFMSRMATAHRDQFQRFLSPLRKHVRDRLDAHGTSLELAVRLVSADLLGLGAQPSARRLESLQQRDGSWQAAGFFRYGRTARWFGSEALSTAFSLRALVNPREARAQPSHSRLGVA